MFVLLASAVLFAVMAFTTKIVSARIPGPQIAMVRFFIALLPLVVPAVVRKAFRWTRLDLVLYRGLFGGIAVLLYFSAIQHIPVGVAALLNYTAPVFSGFFAAAFLGERLRFRVVLPLALTIAGVLLVARSETSPHEILGIGVWELAGLGSAVFAGAAVTAMRGARRTESTWATLTGFSLCGIAATSPFGIAHWVSPLPSEWLLLVLVGLFALAAQLMMTWAYRWVETLVAGVISQFSVVVAMALGALVLHESLRWQKIAGSLLAIGGVILVIFLASRERPIVPDWRILPDGTNGTPPTDAT